MIGAGRRGVRKMQCLQAFAGRAGSFRRTRKDSRNNLPESRSEQHGGEVLREPYASWWRQNRNVFGDDG
jgi:hypothetical protein